VDLAYYGYLARNVAARELARAVAVRARRALGISRERISRRPAREFPALQPAPAAVLREKWPEHCEAVLREAADARDGRLLLFGQLRECSGWHRDPLAPGVEYDPRMPGAEIDLFRPGADAKVMWEIGRLPQLWRFAQARWLTGDPKWTQAWTHTVSEFRLANLPGRGVQWACAMEVSLRAINIALTCALVEAERSDVAEMLDEHCAYVATHLEDTGAVRTNHYAGDLAGIVVAGAMFPELRGWYERFATRLWREIPRQCRRDGTHFESSTGYQRLCCEMFLAPVIAALAADLPVPAPVEIAVHGLFRSLSAVLDARGFMPQIGDLDSCRALPLCTREALDASFVQRADAPEWLWLAGDRGLPELAAATPAASVLLPDAGIAALRAGGDWLCLAAGPNGQGGTGGHAHNDKNSIELAFDGVPLICDRGTYVYARDPAERDARRSTAAHSTVQVDGLEQNRIVPGRLFALPDTARAAVKCVERRDGFEIAVGEHRGFDGLVHRRIAALRPGAAAFVDELRGGGRHLFELRWFVAHDALRERAATEQERQRLEEMHQAGLSFGYDLRRCVEVPGLALFVFGATLPWSLVLHRTDVSPGYAEKRPAHCISLTARGEAPARLFTAVLKPGA